MQRDKHPAVFLPGSIVCWSKSFAAASLEGYVPASKLSNHRRVSEERRTVCGGCADVVGLFEHGWRQLVQQMDQPLVPLHSGMVCEGPPFGVGLFEHGWRQLVQQPETPPGVLLWIRLSSMKCKGVTIVVDLFERGWRQLVQQPDHRFVALAGSNFDKGATVVVGLVERGRRQLVQQTDHRRRSPPNRVVYGSQALLVDLVEHGRRQLVQHPHHQRIGRQVALASRVVCEGATLVVHFFECGRH